MDRIYATAILCPLLLSACAIQMPAKRSADTMPRPVSVEFSCIVEPRGRPDHCQILSNTGSPRYADKVMAWLTGPNQPVTKSPGPIAETHSWTITFQHPNE